MPTVHDAFDAAIHEAMVARARVTKVKSSQVRGVDDVAMLKATAVTWFQTHRPVLVSGAPHIDLTAINQSFTTILNATAKRAAKATYLTALKDTKAALIAAREEALVVPAPAPVFNTDDLAPDFSPLAGNEQMRQILTSRWNECAKCVKADAHLAAIVMMGGLLEALFVARANKMADKSPLTSATNAPKDKTTGKTTNYQDWMLDSYIKVGHELNWITESAKDFADNIKEYRNFVHPAKELRYGVTLGSNDSAMFWQVTKALARQLLLSA
jgi:hypothetical protein